MLMINDDDDDDDDDDDHDDDHDDDDALSCILIFLNFSDISSVAFVFNAVLLCVFFRCK